MDFSLLLDTDTLVAVLAAASSFSAILLVTWPYLARDNLEVRMRQVAEERERIRVRERAGLQDRKDLQLLRAPPKKVYQVIVDRFRMTGKAEDSQAARMLHKAGYRGRGPVVKFLAARILTPILTFGVGLAFIFLLWEKDLAFVWKATIGIGALAFGYYLPVILLKNKVDKRQTSIRRAWPEALDLMLICVESGMSVEAAMRKVSEEIGSQSVALAEELNLTMAELSYLQDRRKAFDNLAARTGLDSVRAVVTGLIQAERYGTPVSQVLRVLAQESRDTRMSEAEKKAAGLPPKLTVPMILFFMPVLFAIIVTPAAIQVLSAK